jgi:hypothetical protein
VPFYVSFVDIVPVCTCGQAQLREVTLQEENAAYEKAISNCESKIQEKIEEAELLIMLRICVVVKF